MIHKTILLPLEKAKQIQNAARKYNCVVLDAAIAQDNCANISVAGNDDDMKALFGTIGENIE